jgi:hypothetical protein
MVRDRFPGATHFSAHLPIAIVSQLDPFGAAGKQLLLQSPPQFACFFSQYIADLFIPRQDFRVLGNYAADLWRSLDMVYNMLLERRFVLLCEFFYFVLLKNSEVSSHGISPVGG